MADENEAGELPADEKAYFESRGEKIPEKPLEEKAETASEAEAGLLEQPEKADKTVPLRALTEAREEGKKTKSELQEIRTKFAVLEDRWNTLLTATAEPEKKADEDPMPDKDQDIFAFTAWQQRQFDKLNAKFSEREQNDAKAKEETQRDTAVWNYWHETSKATKAANPDFEDAVKWMSTERTRQLTALKGLDPRFQSEAGIVQQINQELKQIVIAAAQNNVSPADYVYSMAKEWGYKGTTPTVNPETGKLETLAKNMEAETSLSGAGGSRPGGALDAKAIADMSPNEFEAWYTKHGAAGFKKLQTRGAA